MIFVEERVNEWYYGFLCVLSQSCKRVVKEAPWLGGIISKFEINQEVVEVNYDSQSGIHLVTSSFFMSDQITLMFIIIL